MTSVGKNKTGLTATDETTQPSSPGYARRKTSKKLSSETLKNLASRTMKKSTLAKANLSLISSTKRDSGEESARGVSASQRPSSANISLTLGNSKKGSKKIGDLQSTQMNLNNQRKNSAHPALLGIKQEEGSLATNGADDNDTEDGTDALEEIESHFAEITNASGSNSSPTSQGHARRQSTTEKIRSMRGKTGTLRKKNSFYFHPEFSIHEEEDFVGNDEHLDQAFKSVKPGMNLSSAPSNNNLNGGKTQLTKKGTYNRGALTAMLPQNQPNIGNTASAKKRGTMKGSRKGSMIAMGGAGTATKLKSMYRNLSMTSMTGTGGVMDAGKMVDMAMTQLQEEFTDAELAEEMEKQAEEMSKDKEEYLKLRSADGYLKLKERFKGEAQKDIGRFYDQTEKQLDEIEKLLGVDPVSLKRLEARVKSAMSQPNHTRESENVPVSVNSSAVKKSL